jgi:hypothetical protein
MKEIQIYKNDFSKYLAFTNLLAMIMTQLLISYFYILC